MIITVIDTETTGLKLQEHEIIEIACLTFELKDKNVNILSEYEAKIKPQHIHTATPKALEINGYRPELWDNALNSDEVMGAVNQIIANSDLLMGHFLEFDIDFIKKTFTENNIQYIKFPLYIDTKFNAAILNTKRTSLDFLCKYLNIKFKGRAHTALTDCQRTLKLFEKLMAFTNYEFILMSR